VIVLRLSPVHDISRQRRITRHLGVGMSPSIPCTTQQAAHECDIRGRVPDFNATCSGHRTAQEPDTRATPKRVLRATFWRLFGQSSQATTRHEGATCVSLPGPIVRVAFFRRRDHARVEDAVQRSDRTLCSEATGKGRRHCMALPVGDRPNRLTPNRESVRVVEGIATASAPKNKKFPLKFPASGNLTRKRMLLRTLSETFLFLPASRMRAEANGRTANAIRPRHLSSASARDRRP
jgi:hypothetical protein